MSQRRAPPDGRLDGRAAWLRFDLASSRRRRTRAAAVTLLALLVVASAVVAGRSLRPGPASADREGDAVFLDRHWRLPIAPQGPAPAHYSAIERSLAPESCGVCHPAQFHDWSASLHARSMGPGVMGQLVEMRESDPDTARLCLTCHAPLAEQQPDVDRGGQSVPNPAFDEMLHRQGLVCAVCHVRQHERFGPPRRPGTPASAEPASPPHDGATRHAAFERSEFCSTCHQFAADGFALNGKLLENTYEEWRASPAALRGQHCQTCHMPDRRHLWRGIHDPDMVRSGIDIALTLAQPRYDPGDEVQATVTIVAAGVGHFFPTYVTPKVVVRFALIDAAGSTVEGSVQEHRIGREITLDLSREIADTRIPPGEAATFQYRHGLATAGLRLQATVTVVPADFYIQFFESLLRTGAGRGTAEIRDALAAARRSTFEVWRKELPLT